MDISSVDISYHPHLSAYFHFIYLLLLLLAAAVVSPRVANPTKQVKWEVGACVKRVNLLPICWPKASSRRCEKVATNQLVIIFVFLYVHASTTTRSRPFYSRSTAAAAAAAVVCIFVAFTTRSRNWRKNLKKKKSPFFLRCCCCCEIKCVKCV